MKKLIAIVLLAALTAGSGMTAGAASRKSESAAVTSLVREYNNKQGFETVSVGGLGLGLVKIIAKAAAESPEDRKALEILDGLNRVVVMEYESADPETRQEFAAKVEKVLENSEKILEVKDNGETMNLYGTSSGNGERIDDIILFVPQDCALICLFGKISTEKIADIIEMNK